MNNQSDTNKLDPIDSRFCWLFKGEAEQYEKGFKAYLKKACGYPKHRAWADRLDQSHLTFFEDYARLHSLQITFYNENAEGLIDVAFEKKPKSPFGWA